MPAERVAMRQAREIIRVKFSANIPTREIARRLGLAPSTVQETLKRFEVIGQPSSRRAPHGGTKAGTYTMLVDATPQRNRHLPDGDCYPAGT